MISTITGQLQLTFDDWEQPQAERRTKAKPVELFSLNEYDTVILHLSAGKDSMACLFELKRQGLDFRKLELWHQAVDGRGDSYTEFWDWPCTEPYIEAVGAHFGVPVYYQWREHGLHGELMRTERRTADVLYEEHGNVVRLPTTKGKYSTRRRFPAQSSDLRICWCSDAGKIGPASRTLTNNPRFEGTALRPKKILWVTGERRLEGGNRALYLESELHRTSSSKRIVHHWRPVIDKTQEEIFRDFEEYKIMPHPAYYLGFGRVSCMGCIFSTKHQWAALQQIARERVERFACVERKIGHTMDVELSIMEKAARGAVEKVLPLDDPQLPRYIAMALNKSFSVCDLVMKEWVRPVGADRGCEGGVI